MYVCAIFLESPGYKDPKDSVPRCQTCKWTNTNTNIQRLVCGFDNCAATFTHRSSLWFHKKQNHSEKWNLSFQRMMYVSLDNSNWKGFKIPEFLSMPMANLVLAAGNHVTSTSSIWASLASAPHDLLLVAEVNIIFFLKILWFWINLGWNDRGPQQDTPPTVQLSCCCCWQGCRSCHYGWKATHTHETYFHNFLTFIGLRYTWGPNLWVQMSGGWGEDHESEEQQQPDFCLTTVPPLPKKIASY